MRQLVFGGVTRHLFEQADVPVLFSHGVSAGQPPTPWWARPFAAGQVHAFLEQLAEHLVVAGRQAFDSARASRSMRLDRASEGLVRQMSRRNGGRLRSAAKRSRMFMTGASCLRPGHGGVDIRCVRVWCRLHNATPEIGRAWKRRWNRGGDPYRSSNSAEPERVSDRKRA